MDETVLEIATDKVDTEVPSTTEGVVQELLYSVNDVVPVGSVIARVKTEIEEGTGHKEQEKGEERYKAQDTRHKEEEIHEEAETISHTNITSSLNSDSYRNRTSNNNGRFYSPLVLNIAASEGVGMSELENIPGTGNEGRVTKKDILQYVSQRKSRVRSRESRVISSQ